MYEKDKYEYDIKFVCEPIEQMIKYLNIGTEKSIKELQYFMLDHHRNIISSCAFSRSTIHVIEGAPEDNLIFSQISNIEDEEFVTDYYKKYIDLIDYRKKSKIYRFSDVYISISTNETIQRIHKRGRKCEQWIIKKYIDLLRMKQLSSVYDCIYMNNDIDEMDNIINISESIFSYLF